MMTAQEDINLMDEQTARNILGDMIQPDNAIRMYCCDGKFYRDNACKNELTEAEWQAQSWLCHNYARLTKAA